MKYQSFCKKVVKALGKTFESKTYDESAKLSLNYFNEFIGDDIGLIPSVVITGWINSDLTRQAVSEVLKGGQYQTLSDTLIAAVIAFKINEFLDEPEPPRYRPEDLLRSFLLSYALGYKKGEKLFFEKLLTFGFDAEASIWSPDLTHPDYIAVALNLIESYQRKLLVTAKPRSRYDQWFDGQCGDETTINRFCQLHLLLAKGETGTEDLDSPFGRLADALIPYEVMAYRKLYEEIYGETLPVQGDAVCLIEPWLKPRFENRLEDKTCTTMVSSLSEKLGRDFLAEALD